MAEVGCAGILVKDTFCGPVVALPAEGALLALDEMPVRAGGCAANVAIDLARQGIAVDVAGCIGQDNAGEFLLNTYEQKGVGARHVVQVEGYRTSQCIILLVAGQDRRYLYATGANQVFSVEHISRDWLSKLKVFYLGGLFVLPALDFGRLADHFQYCRDAGVKTVVDVIVPQGVRGMENLKPLLPLIDVFVPNEDEARAFTGLTDPLDQLRAFQAGGAKTVIITRGEAGAVAMRAGRIWRCGAYEMDVVDPSGSGDAFTSGVIRGLLVSWDLPQTLRYASAVGASATRSAGANEAVFSAAEAEAFVAAHPLSVTQVN
jgi:sugar/nucleoside kinase (ribokinase family)